MNQSKDSQILYSQEPVLQRPARFDRAVTKYDSLLVADPQDYKAWSCRGYALEKSGQYEEAVNSFERALSLEPKFAPAWQGKGIALAKLTCYEEA